VNDCVFCEIASGFSNNSCDLPILTTPSFFVIAGRGQICSGYLIICSKDHKANMATGSGNKWAELSVLKSLLRILVAEIYVCEPWFFEHGDYSCDKTAGSCIKHAHIHMLPLPLNRLPQFMLKFELTSFIDGCSIESKNKLKSMAPYFYLELSDKRSFAVNAEGFPCQFGRQLAVREFGLEASWDWRNAKDSVEMENCIARYKWHLISIMPQLKTSFPTLDFYVNNHFELGSVANYTEKNEISK